MSAATASDPYDVSVIIPVLDDEARLVRCLDAIAAQEPPVRAQVLVVDNGSADGTVVAARRHPVVSDVLVERRRGSYAARNTGLVAAVAPVVAFTDADCVPDPDWLASGLRGLRDADLVAGAVRMTPPDRLTPWAVWDAAYYLNQEAFVADGFGATANLFVRREVFDEVGAFDADLLSSGDLEFGKRATGRGKRLAYLPTGAVGHPPRTTARDFWRLHRRLGAGWRVLARKGGRPFALRDPFMRPAYRGVVVGARRQGLPTPYGRLAAVHLVALGARWTGRLTGR